MSSIDNTLCIDSDVFLMHGSTHNGLVCPSRPQSIPMNLQSNSLLSYRDMVVLHSLETQISRKQDGSLSTKVSRKNTHMDKYLVTLELCRYHPHILPKPWWIGEDGGGNARCSTSSMTRSATVTDTGDPISVPCTGL